MIRFDPYRIQPLKAWWFRKWQCECEGYPMAFAARAFTRDGAVLKAERWVDWEMAGSPKLDPVAVEWWAERFFWWMMPRCRRSAASRRSVGCTYGA